ncbi:MAG TPA: hypothetical protein VGX25_05515 [Actinophytocola sp.]|nr:hypothetical protein [Actinophytocola sp.]HEV2778841.1 hypothetical protein [Actinophytocola sp.]
MAKWAGLVDYVRQNYKIADEQPGGVKLVSTSVTVDPRWYFCGAKI